VNRAGHPGIARAALVLGLAALGLWILHEFLPALAWAVVLASCMRAFRRWVQVHLGQGRSG
jgi:predicted PurR-regulated permease PerM